MQFHLQTLQIVLDQYGDKQIIASYKFLQPENLEFGFEFKEYGFGSGDLDYELLDVGYRFCF